MRYFAGLSRQLGVKTSVAFNYTYSDRDSERLDDDYTENRVNLYFTFDL